MSVEAWKSNLEGVIKKWEKKGPPAHVLEKKPIEMNGAVSIVGQNIGRRSKGSRHKSASRSRQDRIKETKVIFLCFLKASSCILFLVLILELAMSCNVSHSVEMPIIQRLI